MSWLKPKLADSLLSGPRQALSWVFLVGAGKGNRVLGSGDLPPATRRSLDLRSAWSRFYPSIPVNRKNTPWPITSLSFFKPLGAGRGNRTPDSTLGRSRLTTKLYPRILTSAVYVVLVGLAMTGRPAAAAETPSIHFDSALISDGKTLSLPDGAKAALFPHALPAEADVTWTVSEAAAPALPDTDHTILGSVYRLTVNGVTSLTPGLNRTLAVVLPMGSSSWQRQLWMYDNTAKVWTALKTGANPAAKIFQATPTSLDALYAVVEDRSLQAGIASWYCRLHCSKRYPTLHGTSNDFPVGNYVTVTSPESGRSVIVKIISRWGQPAGRIIDLSYPAYAALHVKNAGVTKVVVTPSTAPLPVSTTPSVAAETIPVLKLSLIGTTPAPSVSASSFVVYDQTTGTTLASNNAQAVASIASLTKLVTAMVALDSNVSMTKLMTYRRADVTPYAYLRVRVGDTLSVKDLLYSMLVGSANNAATALARSTGLSRAEFIARMNAKVASWGLTQTHFVDVNGLDPGNVSTANDMAVIASHAFHDYPQLKASSLAKSYTFTTRNTKQTHTIKSTDKLLLSGLGAVKITGGKTGYLDEAKYTYVLRTANAQGAEVITVVLGAPSSVERFQSAAVLAQWAWQVYQWS